MDSDEWRSAAVEDAKADRAFWEEPMRRVSILIPAIAGRACGRRAARCFLGGVAATAVLASSPSGATENSDFAAKTVKILIGSEPNGGFDTYGRVFAQFLGAHLPGHPSIVVEDMPGAGSLLAVNTIYNLAPRDGSEIAVIGQVAALNQVLGRPGVHYDVRKLLWIGRLTANSQTMFAWGASGIKTIQDARERQVVVAGTSADSTSVIIPRILNDFIGAQFKVVRGYKGPASATLAVERGEAQAAVRPWNDIKAKNMDWVRERKINLIVQFSIQPARDLPQVPTVVSLARTPEQRQVLSLYAGGGDVGYAIIGPPGLPSAIAATLRRGFDAVMADPDFLAAAGRSHISLDPLRGAALATINLDALDAPARIIDEAKRYMPGG